MISDFRLLADETKPKSAFNNQDQQSRIMSILARLKTALADRYTIQHELGAGTVNLAWGSPKLLRVLGPQTTL